MKLKKAIAFLLALTIITSFISCDIKNDNSTDDGDKTTLTDMIGREVTVIPGSYKRVVCIGAGALRMYTYICDTSLLCGVEDIDNESLDNRPRMFDGVARPYVMAYGDVFKTLPSCGVGGPNAQSSEGEKIISCNPDIIISEYEDTDKANALQSQTGVPVITLRSGADGVFDESFAKSLELLGALFGEEERAAKLNGFITEQKNEIINRTNGIKDEEKPGVYICGLGNMGTTNHLMTAQNYISFDIANVRNIITDLLFTGVQSIEEEKFVSLGDSIDIIIMDSAAATNIKALYKENGNMFDGIKAWQNGEVYLEMAFNAYYTNYEISLINTWFIAKSVYPDLFEDIDIKDKTNEITNMFLRKNLADQIYTSEKSYGGYGKIDTGTFFS